mmetsp:Transcript_173/g.419  ORF Transcript_173/g.419 Transcript_173/m.419 type:complete len:118 (+) Transcript_173:1654-2007(+)
MQRSALLCSPLLFSPLLPRIHVGDNEGSPPFVHPCMELEGCHSSPSTQVYPFFFLSLAVSPSSSSSFVLPRSFFVPSLSSFFILFFYSSMDAIHSIGLLQIEQRSSIATFGPGRIGR